MLRGYDPVVQALLGTLLTWGLTAAGAALVFVFQSTQRKILDGSLGFAAGVMTAASYWSLLDPAIQSATASKIYGEHGEFAFIPVAIGFFLGAVFVYSTDILIHLLGISSPNVILALEADGKFIKDEDYCHTKEDTIIGVPDSPDAFYSNSTKITHRKKTTEVAGTNSLGQRVPDERKAIGWHRLLMLIIAITVHNIPEGLAVGVGFAAVKEGDVGSFEKARNLAIGIGIQNFPEGMAVSLPLRGAGYSVWKSFWYGQLSGMVEPVAALFGALVLAVAQPLLPYALSFAAGAMIYVVVDDIIPEAQTCGNGRLASWGAVVGFLVMMVLDVGLG